MRSNFELTKHVTFCRELEGRYEVIVDLQALFDPWESHAKMTTRELGGTLNYSVMHHSGLPLMTAAHSHDKA